MKRYLEDPVREDLEKKMVFVGGPRQVGKTTLALDLAPPSHRYLNWDILKDREFILKQKFPMERFVIYDELHKFKLWRNYIKGFYDKVGSGRQILVTGSARLDYYRYSGDSLQGRYHYYRLHPLTVAELGIEKQSDFDALLMLGGFPEPFLSGSQRQARRWSREYRSRVINEEIPRLELSQNLSMMELLLSVLPERVGSPLSINAIREDLHLSHKTVSKWLDIFERMYLIYRMAPFGGPGLRSVKKEQKHYHTNWADVSDEGARFENLIAGHLLKWVHFQQDYNGRNIELKYFRDVDRREVDFIVLQDNRPIRAIDCKLKNKGIARGLKYFKAKFPEVDMFQVHQIGESYLSKEGVHCLNWSDFLKDYL